MFSRAEIHESTPQMKYLRINTLFSKKMSEYLIGIEKCSF